MYASVFAIYHFRLIMAGRLVRHQQCWDVEMSHENRQRILADLRKNLSKSPSQSYLGLNR